jgi:hypothetical protein
VEEAIYYLCRSTEHVQWHYPTQGEVENPVKAAERAKKNMEAEKEKAKQKTKAKSSGDEEEQEAMKIFSSYKFVDVKPFGKGRLDFLRPNSIEVKLSEKISSKGIVSSNGIVPSINSSYKMRFALLFLHFTFGSLNASAASSALRCAAASSGGKKPLASPSSITLKYRLTAW